MTTHLSLAIVLCGLLVLLMASPAVAAEPGRSVQVRIEPAQTHQLIEGFGTAYIDWTRPPSEYSDPAFLDLIVNDLGMSLVRQQMTDEMELFPDDADPNHFNWDGFKLAGRDDFPGFDWRMQFLVELKKRGIERFMMTPWTPPAWMKTNRAPRFGGQLRMDKLEHFAEYQAANIILAKRNYGIDVGAISIQNELLFVEPYHSCLYNAWVLRETVRACMRKFQAEGITSRILIPEDMMFVDRMMGYITPTMQDPQTRNFPGEFCTHRQGGFDVVRQWREATKQFGRQNWMTETSGHAQTWQGAMQMAHDMYDYLVGGNFSAWVYWQITDTPRSGVYALMVSGKPTPKYYAAKHFYRYVRPGALRIEGSSSDERLLVSAFRHDVDGTLTLVLINHADAEATVDLQIAGQGTPTQYHVFRSTNDEHCEEKSEVTGPAGQLVMPPQSIVTLQGGSDALKTQPALKPWPEAWKAPAGDTARWGDYTPETYTADDGAAVSTMYGGLNAARRLVRDGKVNVQDRRGWTPLHYAILSGKLDAIRELLQNGADLNKPAKDGWTPLHAAAATYEGFTDPQTKKRLSKYDVFRTVLDAKPDVKARTEDGWTALHAAVTNAHTGWQQDPQDDPQRIHDLIAAGVDIDAADANGRTALHWAAWQGYDLLQNKADIVQVLLEAKADVNARDHLGRTPLHYAAQQGFEAITAALMKAGADPSIKDNAGQVADLSRVNPRLADQAPAPASPQPATRAAGKLGPELLRAAWDGDTDKVRQLLAQGADVFYTDSDGFRPIDRARDNGHQQIVNLLREAEGNPQTPSTQR